MAGAIMAAGAWDAPEASAQVNTEKLRSWNNEGFSGSTAYSLTWRTGNVNLILLGANLRLQWASFYDRPKPLHHNTSSTNRQLKDLFYLILNGKYGTRGKDNFINNGFGHFRWTHMWLSWLGTELFTQIQYNEFIRLRQRFLAGGGFRADVIEEDYAEVHLGTTYMLEFENLDVPDDGVDEPQTLNHRWSNYLSIKLYLSEPNVSLVETIYIQPRFDDFADIRVISEAELQISLGSNFSFAIGLSIRFDNRPPAEVEKLDTTLTNRIRYAF